jgi:hypothetical protein
MSLPYTKVTSSIGYIRNYQKKIPLCPISAGTFLHYVLKRKVTYVRDVRTCSSSSSSSTVQGTRGLG